MKKFLALFVAFLVLVSGVPVSGIKTTSAQVSDENAVQEAPESVGLYADFVTSIIPNPNISYNRTAASQYANYYSNKYCHEGTKDVAPPSNYDEATAGILIDAATADADCAHFFSSGVGDQGGTYPGGDLNSGTINSDHLVPGTMPFIHQVLDTPNEFDGRHACGASSAVMIAAYYQRLSPWPVPSPHPNNFGAYVSRIYEKCGYTFNYPCPDASGNIAYGAYGYIHDYYTHNANVYYAAYFLQKHGIKAIIDFSPSSSEAKSEIDKGHPIWASTTFWGGHIVVIKGYSDNGTFIVNDPWPEGYPSSTYIGENMHYTWTQMGTGSKWVVYTEPWCAGDSVRPTIPDLKCRVSPDINAPEVSHPNYPGYVPSDSTGTIQTDPAYGSPWWYQGGYVWWKISWDKGFSGWCAFSTKASGGSAPTYYLEKITPSSLLCNLAGYVKNASTGAAISGASVSITVGGQNYSTTSNSSGYYSFSNIPSGYCQATVQASGYQTKQESFTLNANQTNFRNFLLTPAQGPSIRLISPVGGEFCYTGTYLVVQWYEENTNPSGEIQIFLKRSKSSDYGSPIAKIAAQPGIQRSYPWLVTGPTSGDCYLRIVYNYGGQTYVASVESQAFTIKVKWLFMYYMNNGSDKDLEQFIGYKFASISSEANSLYFTSYFLWDHYTSTDTDAVYKVKNSSNWKSGYQRGVDYWTATDIGLPSSEMKCGEVATLNTFTNFVIGREKADYYVLILFDHGGGTYPTVANSMGPPGVVADGIIFDDGDWLSVKELGQACANVKSRIGKNLDILHLNACLMQMVEVGYEIRNSCNYLVGSENEGWTTTFEGDYLSEVSNYTSSDQLALLIAQKYFDSAKSLGATISVLQLSKISTVVSAIHNLANIMIQNMSTIRTAVGYARLNTQKFAWHNDKDTTDQGNIFLDVKDFANEIMDCCSVQSVKDAARVLFDSVGGSGGGPVIFESHQTGWGNSVFPCNYIFDFGTYGLSIYFPNSSSAIEYQKYSGQNFAFCADTYWDEFLRAYLQPSQDYATISFTPNSFSFSGTAGGANPPSQTLQIRNSGGGTLSWTVSDNATWLSLNPTSGSSTGEWDPVTVSVNTSGLSAGTYSATITISASGASNSPQYVPVTLQVSSVNPSLYVFPTSLDFGTSQTSLSLTIQNIGGGTLSWSASESLTWLSLSKSSGSLGAGQQETISVSVSRSGLSPGTYSGTISFTSNGGNQNVSVSMTVSSLPSISFTPNSFSFSGTAGGANPPSQTLQIRNSGGGTLNWTVSDNATWLSLNPTSGSSTGEWDPVTVSVNTSGLSAGTYSATITISASGASNSPQYVPVTLQVSSISNPSLYVSPTSLNFSYQTGGSPPSAQKVVVRNDGGGTLIWTANISYQNGNNWLAIDPASYTGNYREMTVSVNPQGLGQGTYRAQITITGASGTLNSPRTVSVELVVSFPEKYIRVLSPNGGDVWHLGNSETIRWESAGLPGNLKIELNRDYPSGQWETLFSSTPNDGEESWSVLGGTSSRCRIKITSLDYPDVSDISDCNFAIAGPEPLLFVYPNVLDFGFDQTTLSFKVKNAGGGVLWWSATESVSWITNISKTNGSLAAGQEENVTVTISREGKPPAEYQDEFTVQASYGGSEKVTVKMKVGIPSAIWLEPSTSYISSPQPDFTLTLKVGAVPNIQSIFASLTWDTSKLQLNTSVGYMGVEYGSLFWGGAVTPTPDPGGVSILAQMYGSLTSGPGDVAKIHFTVPPGLPGGTTITVSFRSDPAASIVLGGGLTLNPQTTGALLTVGSAPSNSFNLQLYQGWNMISLPLVTDPNPVTVFQGIKGNWVIFSWDPVSNSYRMNEQVSLALGAGYWLKIYGGDQVVTISGSPYGGNSFSIPLLKGWNTVGNPFLDTLNLSTSKVISQGGEMSLEEAMSQGILSPFFLWDPTLPNPYGGPGGYVLVGASGQFLPGKGYWVKAYQNCTLVMLNVPPPP